MKALPNILMTAAAIFAVMAGVVWMLNQHLPPAQYDLHDRMREATKPEEGLTQVQFAHVGRIDTPDGRFEVALEFVLLEGMLSAHGHKDILLFSSEGTVAKRIYSTHNEPLWCEGSRICLDHPLGIDIRIDPVILAACPEDGMPTGNVIDFSDGIEDPLLTDDHEFAAGATARVDP